MSGHVVTRTVMSLCLSIILLLVLRVLARMVPKKTVRSRRPAFNYFAMPFYDVSLLLRILTRMVPKKLSGHAAPRTVISLCLFSCEHCIIIIPSRGVFSYRKRIFGANKLVIAIRHIFLVTLMMIPLFSCLYYMYTHIYIYIYIYVGICLCERLSLWQWRWSVSPPINNACVAIR